MENITKMHVWILKPIQFMQKDEEGFIGLNDIRIVFRGNSIDSLKMIVYIKKNAGIYDTKIDIYSLPIKKIENDNKKCDFFIKFPEDISFPATDESFIKKEKYLSPIEVEYSISTIETIKNKKPEYYSSLEFDTLIEYVVSDMNTTNYTSQKEEIKKMIKCIPSSLKKHLEQCDDEKLDFMKEEWKIELEESQDITGNGERKKLGIRIEKMIIGIINREIKRRKEIRKPNKLNDMTITELKEEQDDAVKQCDFELAARIRDIIKSRETAS